MAIYLDADLNGTKYHAGDKVNYRVGSDLVKAEVVSVRRDYMNRECVVVKFIYLGREDTMEEFADAGFIVGLRRKW